MGDTSYLQRAFAAYYREAARRHREEGLSLDQPGMATSREVGHNGKAYVVLGNVRGILAVYRIKPDGLLRRLKRWPNAIDPDAILA